MSRRIRTRVVLLALFAAALLGGIRALAQEKSVVAFGWVPTGEYLGFYVALDQGHYKSEGIDMELVRGFGAGDTAKRVAAGAVPFGVGDTSALIVGRSKEGWRSKVVAMKYQTAALAYYTMKDSGIREPKDLVGKKIGEPPGGAMRVLFPALAEANGFDMSKVNFISMSADVTIPSLLAGKVDAIGLFTSTSPVLARAAKKEGKEIHGIVFADFGVKIYGNSIQALEKLITEKPDLVRGMVRATLKGYIGALRKPEEAAAIYLRFLPTANREIVLDQFQVFRTHMVTPVVHEKGLGYVDEKAMEYNRDLISRLFKLEQRVPVEDLYTNEFLPGLKP